MPDIGTIFKDGIAPGLIIFGVLFFYFKFWPWYTARMAAKDAEENRRHNQFIATQVEANRIQAETNHLIERFTVAVNGMIAATHGIGQLVSTQTDKMDDYHDQVMSELRKRP